MSEAQKELNKLYKRVLSNREKKSHGYNNGVAFGMRLAVEQIAKDSKHADVKDWLKEDDTHA
jgi:hypothetical protein